MKLLIISGTPKKDGLCFSLAEAAFAAAETAGADAELVKLGEYKLAPCAMCGEGWGTCSGKHRCEFGKEDGFDELQSKCAEADAFVYVTPVYWSEVSETLKLFFDKLRRCEATKQWGGDKTEVSILSGKPSILVVSAGGGGGGIVTALAQMERAVGHMGGDAMPRERKGIFDYVAVNRWNQDFKREALKASVTLLVKTLI